MELRHLRYFVAVAEEGSVTLAAKRRLHTAQPSLSRQLQDLEFEVGARLLTRSARGVELTAAGRAFLDHARTALSQVEAAVAAARRAARPAKPSFTVGFLTGLEMKWLPEAMRLLREELAEIEVTISSRTSPELALGIADGTVDVAFMRPERGIPDLAYARLVREPLTLVLPRDHRLAAQDDIGIAEIAGERFIGVSNTAPVLRVVIEEYLAKSGLSVTPEHRADNLAMALSLVASTHGVALLPAYARTLFPPSVTARSVRGDPPTVDLVIGYSVTNQSPTLRRFLSGIDALVARTPQQWPGDQPPLG